MAAVQGGQVEIAVAVVDDAHVVHAGLAVWLTGSRPPMRVAASFADPASFSSAYPESTSQIDVVLFALQYQAGRPQFDALRRICQAGHRVIVYSHRGGDEIILTSLDAGAMSYVGKSEEGVHLREAICAVSAGRSYAGPAMAQALQHDTAMGRPRLTQREREILLAWIHIGSKCLVADRQFVETTTVRGHLERIRAKYAAVGRPAATKAALTARAIQDGFVCPEEV